MKTKVISSKLINLLDLHTHTVASFHAFSTLYELAVQAMNRNLLYLGISDHAPKHPNHATTPGFFRKFSTLPSYLPEMGTLRTIKFLKGVELNIINPDGDVDLEESVIRRLDYVIVSLHPGIIQEKLSKNKNTKTFLKAIEKLQYMPTILGHLYDPKVPVDFLPIIDSAVSKGVLLEVNNALHTGTHPRVHDCCLEMLTFAKRYPSPVILNSDAHIYFEVGDVPLSLQMINEVQYPHEQIVNNSESLIHQFLAKKEYFKK